jgi:hypothetical protein
METAPVSAMVMVWAMEEAREWVTVSVTGLATEWVPAEVPAEAPVRARAPEGSWWKQLCSSHLRIPHSTATHTRASRG